ncbi:TonB-dependent receptor [Hymenobacter tibetensis]|uniref:TonB-dependent receptor n=1 Tax=Hymenobacter tibetensis TaxID=497967 RepID=A0ABY4D1F0_9BACT|nr:TonB-dependent receptor [Hymenobacter tibetensis]UOG76345.1 TonB-dependent receptor [Hymenobacter tibetensis]
MKLGTLVVGGFLLHAVVGHAQTQPGIATPDTTRALPEVPVVYQADRLTPVTFLDLDGRALARKSVGQEPSFLLSETPAITAYSDAGSTQGYAYFRLRGIDQTRVNTTLNGVPLNEPEDQGAYFSNFPDILNSVSAIQIQRGVGTTQNGTASYGGSIQLFSPTLRDSAHTTLGAGYGSYNSYRIFGEYASGLRNQKALYVRASELHSDGYKDRSANTSRSVFVSSGLFRDKTSWKLNLLAGHQQNQLAWLGVADSVLQRNRRANANSSAENDRFTQGLVQLQNDWQLSATSLLSTSVYYSALRGNYDFDLNNFLDLPSTAELYKYAFQSGWGGAFSTYTRRTRHLTWTSGLHANTYQRQHTGTERALGQLYRNTGRKQELSVFSKLEAQLQRFTLFADAQFRTTSFRYEGGVPLPAIDWQFFNPKVGVSFAASDRTTLYYSLGRTSREPTRNDLFGGNDDLVADSTGLALVTSSTPESVVDQELGMRHATDKWQLNLNAYYMDFRNEIVLNGQFGPNGLALTNKVESSLRTGLEASVRYQLTNRFALINNSAFSYSRIREQREAFEPVLTPPLIVNQEAVYQAGRWTAALLGRYQSRSYIDFANSATVDDYVLLNARLQYARNGYQVSLFANNLTNAKYFNNGYVEADGTRKYFVQAPVNFYLNAQYSF